MNQAQRARELPGDNEVHVWQFPLQHVDAVPDVGRLSVAERNRAQRFRFERHRRRFCVRRARLRSIISAYSGIDAGASN